ncbi:hypothetical protein KS4_18340 [Poriferisphaera corsica]|uniref:Chromosomal replication initiator DnaA C-terminal domain-containing protein n=1 Tax=Poriferisphaera corsica TaxID=2528020 RepID=A0A517YU97_9BACT|nr:hypothetical protein [Poriferisphaera corsica]QDU33777.1 hypothetical protein KS4_18340 [Poriferisphaera corsica]
MRRRLLTSGDVLDVAGRFSRYSVEEIISNDRRLEPRRIRHACAHIMRERCGMTLQEIATSLGRKKHNAALNMIRRATEDFDVQCYVREFESELRNINAVWWSQTKETHRRCEDEHTV